VDAQLHLLHHQVHLVARRQTLHQGQRQRRLAVRVVEFLQRRAQALAGRVQGGAPLPAAPVEQDRLIAGGNPQNLQGMVGRIGGQFDGGTRMQGKGAEESRYHDCIIPNS